MTTRAVIFVETVVGKSQEVVKALRQIEGVSTAELVTGPYDAVALIEAADLTALGGLVMQRIQALPGIVRTTTCLVVRV